MRANIFRGKGINNGEWIHGDLYQKEDWYIIDNIFGNYVVVDAETVGQYTGLEAHCGDIVEDVSSFLFEGDVCELKLFNPVGDLDNVYIGTIDYYNGAFWFVSINQEDIMIPLYKIKNIQSNLTILGNKYDHLELLKRMYL